MSDLVNEMLGKFMALSQEEKEIAAGVDAAFKEYNDYCADSEKDLNKKIQEINEKIHSLDYFLNYAKEHANAEDLEPASEPFDTPLGTLESLRQTIKLDSHNDPNAESLYTKATGKKLLLEQDIIRARDLIEGSKVQAKRQYDSDTAKFNKQKVIHQQKVREFVESPDFEDFLKLLAYDKSAFNSISKVTLNDREHITLGMRRVKLSLPLEIEQDVAISSNGEYNAASHTISAPYQVSVVKGSSYFFEYEERNLKIVLGGIQRLILNFIKYFGDNLTSVIFCEPERFDVDLLGNISALAKGINSFITVPKTSGELSKKISKLAQTVQSSPNPSCVSSILVLHNFPQNYSDEDVQIITDLCKNSEQYGLLVLLTHNIAAEATSSETAVREVSKVVRSRNGVLWFEKEHENLVMYSAPSDISEEMRKKYIEKRRHEAMKATQDSTVETAKPAASVPTPAPVPVPAPVPSSNEFAVVEPVVTNEIPSVVPVPTSTGFATVAPVEIDEPVKSAQSVSAMPEVAKPNNSVYSNAESSSRVSENAEIQQDIKKEDAVIDTVERSKPQPNEAPVKEAPKAEKPVPGKGVRKLPAIPIGRNVDGKDIMLDISGNITYICGNKGNERKAITNRIIYQIMAESHPDDVELWMLDCGDGDLMKYADGASVHIKYLVSDSGAETSLDFIDVISEELEWRVEAFAQTGRSRFEEISAEVFMPRIEVIVNNFPKFYENTVKSPKYFGRNHVEKLSRLFKNSIEYGIQFILIGDEFSTNGELPLCFENCIIHSAAVVAGRDTAVEKIFSGVKLYENEIESLKRIPQGCAFVADENSTNGLTLVRIMGEDAKCEHSYTEVSEYSENGEEYLNKQAFVEDRNVAGSFNDYRIFREKEITARESDECLLFLGKPYRFMPEYPVRMYDDFGENLLAIAPAREKNSAALMVRAALRSLKEQGIKAEILAFRSNPVYSELKNVDELKGIEIFEGVKAEERIKNIVERLSSEERSCAFEIVLGGDLLMSSMLADDMLPILKRALVNAPRAGTHFMFVSGSAAQSASGFLSLFRHRVVFACPYNEAEKILRAPNFDLPENCFRLSNDYDELNIQPYSMV